MVILLIISTSSCSTGIEHTKTIKMSKTEQKILLPSPEELFIDSIQPLSLRDWKSNKLFLISDNRALLVYDIYDNTGRRVSLDSLANFLIAFDHIEQSDAPSGQKTSSIVFNMLTPDHLSSGNHIVYNTNKPIELAENMIWCDFPMLIDLSMVEDYRNKLKGRQFWIKTSLWYDIDGIPLKGAKFVPVTINDIQIGNSIFPLSVLFHDGNRIASIPMNMAGRESGFESRTFQSLFSLSNPKNQYPDISPDVWQLICRGNVKQGMTKTECKLALGAPQEVDSGHDWNNLIDFWRYSDGTFLRFQDGLLIDYRK